MRKLPKKWERVSGRGGETMKAAVLSRYGPPESAADVSGWLTTMWPRSGNRSRGAPALSATKGILVASQGSRYTPAINTFTTAPSPVLATSVHRGLRGSETPVLKVVTNRPGTEFA